MDLLGVGMDRVQGLVCVALATFLVDAVAVVAVEVAGSVTPTPPTPTATLTAQTGAMPLQLA
jgi:hypothetical protein